jgi:uncharacterized protein DUF4864
MFERLTLALCAVLAMVALAGGAPAQSVSEADATSFRQIISDQIAAFNADDGPKAWSFASPSIQQLFPTPEVFMSMVRQGYQPVYRPRVFDFREIVTLHGQVTQKVHVVGPDGRPVTAFYPMVQLPDGTWRINGCFLQAPEEHQA